MPRFSVLMAAYNVAGMIGEAIASVQAQTERDWELIVVDDGSTDDTAARVQPFLADPRVRLIRQENRGLSGARNTALGAARAPLISILDADDLYLPSYLETMGNALERDGGAGFAYTDPWLLDDFTGRIRRRSGMADQRPPVPPPADPRALLLELVERNFVFVAATVRRSAFEAVGDFDTRLRSCEDYLLWLRIAASGRHAVRPAGSLAIYRRRAGSLTQNESAMFRAYRDVMRIAAAELPLDDELRARAEARVRELTRYISAVEGTSALPAALLRARRLAGRAKRRLIDHRLWYADPPPEVAAAFPKLGRGQL